MSYKDFSVLITRIFDVQILGCPIIYGISNNDQTFWDNSAITYLGWKPQDNSEVYREKVDANSELPDENTFSAKVQGGWFADEPIYK